MNNWFYIVHAFFLVAAFLMYFKIAHKYQIVDLPNHRTMHEGATIRGRGIVICFAVALFSLLLNNPGYYFLAGLTILGITGFLDDLYDLPSKIRFPIQVLSIVMILAELNLFELHWLWLVIFIILATGTLNAFNFMDGINGMTGGYGIVALISLIFVNNYVDHFIANDFLFFFLLSLIVFGFFNFRKKAVCFAGDVGSLAIAFIIIYLVMKLVSETQQLAYILFFTLYGIDTIFTIFQRILKRENIFDAHRMHLFQVAVSKTGMSHLRMSGVYMIVQLVINSIVIVIIQMNFNHQLLYSGMLLFLLSAFYVVVKNKLINYTI